MTSFKKPMTFTDTTATLTTYVLSDTLRAREGKAKTGFGEARTIAKKEHQLFEVRDTLWPWEPRQLMLMLSGSTQAWRQGASETDRGQRGRNPASSCFAMN